MTVVQLQGHYQQAQAIVDQHYNNTYRQVEDICSGKYLANIDWQHCQLGGHCMLMTRMIMLPCAQVDQQLESAQQLVAQRRSNSPQRPYPVRPKNRVRNHSLQGFVNLQKKILIGRFCLNMKLKLKDIFPLRTQTCCQPSCA